jgi:hypothetical protein
VTVKTRVFQTRVASAANYTDRATLASVALPAGQFVVTAKLSVDNDTNTDETIDCDLTVPGTGNSDNAEAVLGDDSAENAAEELVYALQATFTSNATSSVNVSCEQLGADNDAADIRIIAVLQN